MSNRRSHFLSFALLTLCAVAVAGCTGKDANKTVDTSLPERLTSTIEFRFNRKDAELPRTVQHAADGQVLEATVPYESGKTGLLTYWTEGPGKGKVKSGKIYFPKAEGQSAPQLAREFEIDQDGAYISDIGYAVDGKTTFVGKRDGASFTRTTFGEDGKAITKVQDYAVPATGNRWQLLSEKEFDENSVLRRHLVRLANGKNEVKSFSEQSVLQSRSEISAWNDRIQRTVYESDGQTIAHTIDEVNNRFTIKQYRNGNPSEERIYAYGLSKRIPNAVTITIYDDSGTTKFRQFWNVGSQTVLSLANDPSKKLESSHFALGRVETLSPQGKTEKSIDFWPDQKTPKVIAETKDVDAKGWDKDTSRKTFREDGTMSTFRTYEAKGSKSTTGTHTIEENVRETVDEALLRLLQFQMPERVLRKDE